MTPTNSSQSDSLRVKPLHARGKLLGVHIGVYQSWYSVQFSNTWYKWQGEL